MRALSARPANVLQRQCACGRPAPVGGECEQCRRAREQAEAAAPESAPLLQRAPAAPPPEAPSPPGDFSGVPTSRRLVVGPVDDAYEREADRVAAAATAGPGPALGVRRLQAKAGAGGALPQHAPAAVASYVDSLPGRGGARLPDATRQALEPRLGHDLGGVRVHADGAAAQAARGVRALAFTVGRDVVFGAGQYAPDAPAGQRLLAHELTHVVQQSGGSGTPETLQRVPWGSCPSGTHLTGARPDRYAAAEFSALAYYRSVNPGHCVASNLDLFEELHCAGAEGRKLADHFRSGKNPRNRRRVLPADGVAAGDRASPSGVDDFEGHAYDAAFELLRPDIIDFTTHEMYDVTTSGLAGAKRFKLEGYVKLATTITGRNWRAGKSLPAPGPFYLNYRVPRLWTICFGPTDFDKRPGVIAYDVIGDEKTKERDKREDEERKRKNEEKKRKKEERQRKREERQRERERRAREREEAKRRKKGKPEKEERRPKERRPKEERPKEKERAKEKAPSPSGGNFGFGISILGGGGGAGNAGVGVSIMSNGHSYGTVGAGVVYDSDGVAVGSVGVGASSGSTSVSAGTAGASASRDSTSAVAGAAGAGSSKDSTSAAAGVAGASSSKDDLTATAGRAGKSSSEGQVGAQAGGGKGEKRTGDEPAGGGEKGTPGGTSDRGAPGGTSATGGDKGTPGATGDKGGTGDKGTPGGTSDKGTAGGAQGPKHGLSISGQSNATADRMVEDAAKVEDLIRRATPAQRRLMEYLAAVSGDDQYVVPSDVWVKTILGATGKVAEDDLAYLITLEWRPGKTTPAELQAQIAAALRRKREGKPPGEPAADPKAPPRPDAKAPRPAKPGRTADTVADPHARRAARDADRATTATKDTKDTKKPKDTGAPAGDQEAKADEKSETQDAYIARLARRASALRWPSSGSTAWVEHDGRPGPRSMVLYVRGIVGGHEVRATCDIYGEIVRRGTKSVLLVRSSGIIVATDRRHVPAGAYDGKELELNSSP